MTKANITQYSSTPSSNADINDINIAENCPASGLNNAIRELMAHLKNVDTGSQALTALSVAGSVTATTSLKTPLIEFTDGDNALTIADGGNVTANANLTVSGDLIASSLNGGQFGGRRNLIINGAMQVAQRGTSFTSKTSDHYIVDRFTMFVNGAMGTWTTAQSTTVPTGEGFAKSISMDCTTADASPASSDILSVQQRFEGQDLQQLKKGTSSAESLTATFYVRSNKTGTYIAELEDRDNTRYVSQSYTISSADTWEKKTVTFPADTSGALNNDNGESLRLNFWLGGGSDFTSGTLGTSWHTTATNRAVGQVNLADSTSNEWYVTGVQLEVGEQATPFEHRSFGEELALCQRYFRGYRIVLEYPLGVTGTVSSNIYSLSPSMRSGPSVDTSVQNVGASTSLNSFVAKGSAVNGYHSLHANINISSTGYVYRYLEGNADSEL